MFALECLQFLLVAHCQLWFCFPTWEWQDRIKSSGFHKNSQTVSFRSLDGFCDGPDSMFPLAPTCKNRQQAGCSCTWGSQVKCCSFWNDFRLDKLFGHWKGPTASLQKSWAFGAEKLKSHLGFSCFLCSLFLCFTNRKRTVCLFCLDPSIPISASPSCTREGTRWHRA